GAAGAGRVRAATAPSATHRASRFSSYRARNGSPRTVGKTCYREARLRRSGRGDVDLRHTFIDLNRVGPVPARRRSHPGRVSGDDAVEEVIHGCAWWNEGPRGNVLAGDRPVAEEALPGGRRVGAHRETGVDQDLPGRNGVGELEARYDGHGG